MCRASVNIRFPSARSTKRVRKSAKRESEPTTVDILCALIRRFRRRTSEIPSPLNAETGVGVRTGVRTRFEYNHTRTETRELASRNVPYDYTGAVVKAFNRIACRRGPRAVPEQTGGHRRETAPAPAERERERDIRRCLWGNEPTPRNFRTSRARVFIFVGFLLSRKHCTNTSTIINIYIHTNTSVYRLRRGLITSRRFLPTGSPPPRNLRSRTRRPPSRETIDDDT